MTRTLLRSWILSALLALVSNATAQMSPPRLRVHTFGVGDGLPASVVSGLAQSADNLLWLTTGNGLSCYDGYRFTTFRSLPYADQLLSTNHLTVVLPSASGGLWTANYADETLFFSTTTCQYVNLTRLIDQRFHRKTGKQKVYTLASGHTWLIGKDGHHYRVADSALPDPSALTEHALPGTVRKVAQDALGREWMLTDRGTYLMRPTGLQRVSTAAFDYLCTRQGQTWLFSIDGRMASCASGSETLQSRGRVAARVRINDVLAMADQTVYLSANEGVFHLDKRSVQPVQLSALESHELHADSLGRVWCFGKNDIALYGKASAGYALLAHFESPKLDPDCGSGVECDRPLFHIDNNGQIWVSNGEIGFSRYVEDAQVLMPEALPDIVRIKSGFSDRQGNLWLVLPHALSLVTFQRPLTQPLYFGYRDARAVCQLRDGSYLLGTGEGLLVKFSKNGELIGFLQPSGAWGEEQMPFSYRVYALHEDWQGRLWIGTKGRGLYCLAGTTLTQYLPDKSDPYSLGSENVYDIAEDRHGRLLVATYGGGLNIMEPPSGSKKARFHRPDNDLRGYDNAIYNKVRRIETLPDGTVLLSTNGGLLSFSDTFRRYADITFFGTRHREGSDALLSSEILQTCRTSDGTVYVVTRGGGLQRVATRKLLQSNLPMADVLTSEGRSLRVLSGYGTLQGLAADSAGGLWIVGEARVAMLREGVLREYGPETLGAGSFSEARPYSDGQRLLIATEGGAITFRAEQMLQTPFSPNILFTSLRTMDSEQDQPLLHTTGVTVDADHRAFMVYFSSLDYSTASSGERENIRYAYRLDDEGEWLALPAGANCATFNHFPHGRHTLAVRSTNSMGVWLDNECRLEIYAEPTFLESWWGRTLIALVLLALLALAVRAYMRRRTAEITEEVTEGAEADKVRYVLRKPEIVDEEKVFMEHFMAFLEEHIADENLKAEDMADALGMSRSAFYAQVKQIVDMSPVTFLRHVRMTRAEDLVRDSTMTFSQIAYATGFTDPKYFSKCFKKRTGLSPSDYRQQHRP